ncbi:MAG: SDR family NAD(P)-dependent oxidoreductase [Dehalococcoidia bacterium]
MGDLDGRVALVTGGSRGIGRAICLRLAQDGADIAINYHSNADAAQQVADEVRALGRRAEIYAADVAVEEDCRRLAESALADFGHVDILVNNAGIGATAVGRPLVADSGPEPFERLMAAHAYGPFYLCQSLLPQMRDLDRGDVVMISSVAAQGFGATGGTYSAAKSAMEALAHTLAKEERANNIHVNIVAPGLVETDMGLALVKFTRGVQSMRELDASQPFGRVGRPEDIANAVAYFVGPRAAYVTNQRLTVSGS